MSSSQIRLVASSRSKRQTRPTSVKSSTSLLKLPSGPPSSHEHSGENCETLGNKLQRLAIMSPEHIECVELLVDQILKGIEDVRRIAMPMMVMISGAIAPFMF